MNRFAALALLAVLPGLLSAQPFTWTTFTSTSNVEDMMVADGRIWIATSGGLASYDPAAETFEVYTNTRGLAMNGCVAIGRDAYGFIWAAHPDARITRLDPVTGRSTVVVDLQREVYDITDILRVGDDVFISTNNGVYRFSYMSVVDDYRVKESHRQLGDFPSETRVNALAVTGQYLYAGTGVGLARMELADLSPDSSRDWHNLTSANSGLVQNDIRALEGSSSELLIATPSFIQSLTDTFGPGIGIGGVISFFIRDSIRLAVTETQVWTRVGATGVWSAYGETLTAARRAGFAEVNSVTLTVVGLADGAAGIGGLVFSAHPETESWSRPRRAPSLGANFITSLAVDPQGRLWVSSGSGPTGVYVYDGVRWTNYMRATGYTYHFFNSDGRGFVFDDFGGTWAASQGGGTAWFHDDTVTVFDGVDTSGFSGDGRRLSPVPADWPSDTNFVVTRVARNAAGDVYMTNRLARTGLPLVRVSAAWIARGNNRDPWDYYTPRYPAGQHPAYLEVEEVIVDALNRVWMGATGDGEFIYVLNDNGTPPDTTDDHWFWCVPSDVQDAVTCFEAINKQVLTWQIDHQGYLWIGTVNGAYYTQGGVPDNLDLLHFVCAVDMPIGHQVNDIHVDAHDNKWFGTDEGVAVLDRNFTWVLVFQMATSVEHPSGLTSDEVQAITSNPRTGEVWIGTNDGLSRYRSPYVQIGGDLGDVWPYPNPFRADGRHRLRLDPVRIGGKFDELRVFTISGRLVRKLTWAQMVDPGAGGGWDGRNDDAVLVAGGVYLLVVSSSDGKTATGKVAVLGR